MAAASVGGPTAVVSPPPPAPTHSSPAGHVGSARAPRLNRDPLPPPGPRTPFPSPRGRLLPSWRPERGHVNRLSPGEKRAPSPAGRGRLRLVGVWPRGLRAGSAALLWASLRQLELGSGPGLPPRRGAARRWVCLPRGLTRLWGGTPAGGGGGGGTACWRGPGGAPPLGAAAGVARVQGWIRGFPGCLKLEVRVERGFWRW